MEMTRISTFQNEKETPSKKKDVSIFGVEQGGTVEKPWPPMAS